MYDLVGSIVAYRTSRKSIREAIASFLNTDLSVRLYVVDNSPDDRLRDACRGERVGYMYNGRNLGFGAGHNMAMRRSLGRTNYHVVLNPDVYFEKGVLEGLLSFARSRPDVGLVMPKILNLDGSMQHLCKQLPSPADLMARRFLPSFLKPLIKARLARYELRDQDYDSVLSVPVLSGCFMMLNCAAISEVGVFDERFFMYMEDVDLCRRMQEGFETIYFPKVAIYHVYGKGSYRSLRLMLCHVVSALKYFQKWGWFLDPERIRINQRRTSVVVLESGKEPPACDLTV